MQAASAVDLIDPQETLSRYEEVLRLQQELINENPDDAENWVMVASVLLRLAGWFLEQGNEEWAAAYSHCADEAENKAAALKFGDENIDFILV